MEIENINYKTNKIHYVRSDYTNTHISILQTRIDIALFNIKMNTYINILES